MKCPGAGQAPKTLYKTIRHYQLRDGRPWHQNGQGECSHCGACHAVQPLKDGRAVLVRHKDIRTCSEQSKRMNARRKEVWLTHYHMNNVTGATPIHNWGGGVMQYVNVAETPSWVRSLGYSTRQTWAGDSTFRVEIQSQSRNELGQYVFNINDQIYVAPTDRMTVAVDYASWNAWNNTITVSNYARIDLNQTWHNWTQGPGQLQAYSYQDMQAAALRAEHRVAYTAPREDPVVLAERRQREAEALFQRVEADRRAKTEAQQKAEQTLLSLLTPEQRAEYRQRKHFHIRGSKGTLYRILHGSSGNVRQVLTEADEGRGLHAYCAHPAMSISQRTAEETGISAGMLPHEDAMIAQMLQLMVDEDSFLAVANRHW